MEATKRRCRGAVRRQLGLALRCLEVGAALIVVSWSSTHLPAAGELLRRLAASLLSPRFLFLLGNAIVLLLLRSYAHYSLSPVVASREVHGECLDLREQIQWAPSPPAAPEAEEEEKEVVYEPRRRRRRSERRRRGKDLRRSPSAGEDSGRKASAEDDEGEEDSEEFRRTIEAFIAKQTRFHREESLAIVSSA